MIDQALLNLLPPLRRARGDRLYGPDQSYWVDLWKQEGAWLLGHRPEGAAKEWKNQIDKGLGTWAPSLWPRRLEPLVKRLVPEAVAVRVFRNVDRCPVTGLWRPWGPTQETGAWRLVLPTGPGQAVAVAFSEAWPGSVPGHDVTSPAEAAALVRAAAQILRFTGDAQAGEERERAALAFDRHLGASGLFRRSGLWFEILDKSWYPKVFQAHFESGFFLNPDPQGLSIIPTSLSAGEWAKWKTVAEGLGQGRR